VKTRVVFLSVLALVPMIAWPQDGYDSERRQLIAQQDQRIQNWDMQAKIDAQVSAAKKTADAVKALELKIAQIESDRLAAESAKEERLRIEKEEQAEANRLAILKQHQDAEWAAGSPERERQAAIRQASLDAAVNKWRASIVRTPNIMIASPGNGEGLVLVDGQRFHFKTPAEARAFAERLKKEVTEILLTNSK